MLNKSDLISGMVKRSGLTKKYSAKALNALISTITDTLAKKQGVRLIGFGSFKVTRKGRNPQTGKSMTISARNYPAFKAGKSLKKSVNK